MTSIEGRDVKLMTEEFGEIAELPLADMSASRRTFSFEIRPADDTFDALRAHLVKRTNVQVLFPDGDEVVGEAVGTVGDPAASSDGVAAQVVFEPILGWQRHHVSTAKLRRELRERATSRARKGRIWAWLQYRRKTR